MVCTTFSGLMFFRRIGVTAAVVAVALAGGVAWAAGMQYDVKPGQIVPYRVTIEANTPAEKDTMTGIIAFTGKRSEGEQFTIEYRGGLTRKKLAKAASSPGRGPRGIPGRPGGPPVPRGGPMSRFETGVTFDGLTQTTNTLVVGQSGEIKSLTGQSQLPYLLGNLSILLFEALPDGDERQWQVGSGVSITKSRTSPFPRGPFGSRVLETRTGGSESAEYAIRSDDGKLVTIAKTYKLHSPAATGDDATLDISGSGTYVFNRELGVPESLDFKQDFTVTKGGSSVAFPMTVAWNRISEEEYQAHVKAREEQIAKLREQSQQRKPQTGSGGLDPDKKAEILADLRSDDPERINSRLARLVAHKPHPDDADVAAAIRDLQSHGNTRVSMTAKMMWKRWAAILDESGGDQPAGAPPSAPPKPDAHPMRTWSDVTGTFKVEAAFVKADGANVLLKTAEGREISVPISRLSESDRAIVEELSRPGGPENPFQ